MKQFEAGSGVRNDAVNSAAFSSAYGRPVTFDGCFGWLHTPYAGATANTAAVLCPGLKTDELTGYRSLRMLAIALAKAGYPTLRLQYPGTGNSHDCDAAECWARLQQSVHTAADWLRHQAGAERFVLCGLRLGAMLAALVAGRRPDVAGLVLLAPVLRGRTYIRQLIIEADEQSALPPSVGGLIVGGLQFTGETVRLINQVDLRRLALTPCCRVALYTPAPSPILSECIQAWRRCGAKVLYEDFAGLEAMLRPTFANHEAAANVSRIVTWLRAAVPTCSSQLRVDVPVDVKIQTPEYIETPLRFGGENSLFGILCRPTAWAEAQPAVVIGNSSGDPHCNPVTVDLARRLAAGGIVSIRIDFAGLGDSESPGGIETHVFETDRRSDFSAAVSALEDLGYRQFAALGLCSGAYHAFHAALADQRISLVLLLNLPLLQWRHGDPIESLEVKVHSPSKLLRNLGARHSWKRLLQGGIDLRRLHMGFHNWFVQQAWLLPQWLAESHRLKGSPTFVSDSMHRLSQRARTLFLMSQGEVGIEILSQAFGPNLEAPGVTVTIDPGLNHGLTNYETRRIAIGHVIEFLKGNTKRRKS
jgi:pimeloyl-ACP methyl ester carboxylesterase